MWRVPAAGGVATALTVLDRTRDERVHGFPTFLPDDHRFLYSRLATKDETAEKQRDYAVLEVAQPGDGVGLMNVGFDGIPVKAGENYDVAGNQLFPPSIRQLRISASFDQEVEDDQMPRVRGKTCRYRR
jgi:hypothetical protein